MLRIIQYMDNFVGAQTAAPFAQWQHRCCNWLDDLRLGQTGE
jgi:hypothetical protein